MTENALQNFNVWTMHSVNLLLQRWVQSLNSVLTRSRALKNPNPHCGSYSCRSLFQVTKWVYKVDLNLTSTFLQILGWNFATRLFNVNFGVVHIILGRHFVPVTPRCKVLYKISKLFPDHDVCATKKRRALTCLHLSIIIHFLRGILIGHELKRIG